MTRREAKIEQIKTYEAALKKHRLECNTFHNPFKQHIVQIHDPKATIDRIKKARDCDIKLE